MLSRDDAFKIKICGKRNPSALLICVILEKCNKELKNAGKRKPHLWLKLRIDGEKRLVDNDDEKARKDKLTGDYGAVLRESAILTSFSAFLFGFLLNISINSSTGFLLIDKIILLTALFSITISISFFIMPVIYHHLEFPYIDFEKFKARSHRFTLFGLIPAMITLFLGLQLATRSLVGNISVSFLLGAIPFVLVYVFYRLRKWRLLYC